MLSEHDVYDRYGVTAAADLVAVERARVGKRAWQERLDLDTARSVLQRAALDVAIDHFLIAAARLGVFDQNGPIKCRFHGGTRNRKCVNGSKDRMSYDVDLSVDSPEALAQLFAVLDGMIEPPFTFRLRAGEEGRTYRTVAEDKIFSAFENAIRFKVDVHVSEHFLPLVTRSLLPMPASDLYECSTDITLSTLSLAEITAGKLSRLLERDPPTQRDVHDIGTFAAHLTEAAHLIAMVVALNCRAENQQILDEATAPRFRGGLTASHLAAMTDQMRRVVEQKRYITFLPPMSLDETIGRLEDRYAKAKPLVERVQQHILDDPRLRLLASGGASSDEAVMLSVRQDLEAAVEAQPHLLDDPPTPYADHSQS